MLTLLSELRLWSQTSAAQQESPSAVKFLENEKHTQRLRRNLKKLEVKLKHHKLVYCEWIQSNIVQLMLSNGLLAYIVLHPNTSQLSLVAFDKYFIGKLVSEAVHNVIVSKMHILISYNENQITFVHLQRPPVRRSQPTKIHNMEPKIFHFVIGGSIRKTPRHLSCNLSCDLLAVWTKGSQMEVYPWRPTTKDQERANLHIYKLSRMKLELQCYFWTEFDPICIEFSKQHENQLHSIEQRISRKGVVSVESCVYQLNKSKIARTSVTSIPLQTQACCASFSPDHEKIMLGCIDASIILFDEGRGITHLVKAAFIPQHVSWHCDSALLMIANERCQLQCFDISLSCVKNQLLSDEISPSTVLDLSTYLTGPSVNLVKMCFSKKSDVMTHFEKYAPNDTHLVMCLDSGMMACLRIVGGAGMKGDIHKTGFTADVLVHNYIQLGHVEKAINILLSLNWDAYGAMCLVSLHKIANFIFKQPLSSEREVQLQKALGSFHVPVKPLCDETVEEFGDQVDDITRRFFHYMMRNNSFEKAFSLAIDINDADLFMDLYRVVQQHDRPDLAADALKRAEVIYKQIEEDEARSTSSHSTCSRSSCSQCMTESESEEDSERENDRNGSADEEITPKAKKPEGIMKPKLYKSNSADLLNEPIHRPLKYQSSNMQQQYMPPLPQPVKATVAQKIQIPKPELRNKMMTSIMTAATTNIKQAENVYENRPTIDRRILDEPDNNNYGSFSLENLDYLSNRPPKPTPRSFLNPATAYRASEEMLNVIPTPAPQNLRSNRIDQTIGIPVSNENPPNFGIFPQQQQPQRSKPFFPTPYNNASTEFSYKPVFPVPPIIHNHPLIAGNIPSMYPTPPASALKKDNSPSKKEVNSILTNNNAPSPKRDGETNKEKNKVKFSDTVQIAVVPEMPGRKDKSLGVSMKKMVLNPRMANPELAESLPLCHPNDDYLKDFNPMPVEQRTTMNGTKSSDLKNERNPDGNSKKPGSSVKVVHFGVV
ncbi:WD repeat-containing and planar cell polarity effector protein fritz [Culicoides brevitarsis]|uniref:WD repeat-containing and planar cell polarity effector protein fritz n=1 Tax=Culicoides brevitarsis TaxID=469753 RepID=UPI00307B10E7